ncbi:hypothetical protein [Aquisphaera insulae]|uniref:hypothetical protein n=1 Tax=Aquisphaera insulae TaxID=2712864 RepID=UPI0013EC1140|nr:hypothetical protein [Aquisphaera insulae]
MLGSADKSDDHDVRPQVDPSGIRVARYLTDLPPSERREKALHESVRRARERF